MNVQEMKRLACEAIDRNREKIIALAESIFAEPELGYKEFKTAAKVKAVFDELEIPYQDEVAVTGVIAGLSGGEHRAKIAVMGELDAVVCPAHPCADLVTGAAHSCGHHAQIASLAGVAYALKESGVMPFLGGDVALMAVPAEECVELQWRSEMMREGRFSCLGGKQEFVRLGCFDDIDAMLMQHSTSGKKIAAGISGGLGFIAKIVEYTGRECHAARPYEGINALDAARVGLAACDALRTTFRDEDGIRFHPIITCGGNLVNVVPGFVRIETFVRGRSIEAIRDASRRIDRALRAGADALGAQCRIYNMPGYLLAHESPELKALVEENIQALVGEEGLERKLQELSTDASDISNLLPTVHAMVGGAQGIAHGADYRIADAELACIQSAKMLAMSVIDLLADGAQRAVRVRDQFKAPLNKESYLALLEDLKG